MTCVTFIIRFSKVYYELADKDLLVSQTRCCRCFSLDLLFAFSTFPFSVSPVTCVDDDSHFL